MLENVVKFVYDGANLDTVTDAVDNLTSGVTGIIGAAYGLLMAVAVLAIIVLSIISMFCDEQSAMRYKRWRMNVIKATVVGFCIGAVFALIKGIAGSYWGSASIDDLAKAG